ncbi:hypothetical protein PAPYR_12483 [Paratrimastix pyriformis]|uniref:Uncharacterized protein n=1 Tax=Paratrimastix pyriformis TaxID=342808 RepID=A0ABQ8U3F8_9EUKA|nr:hypothetical protein PAPYR_12483 [Paratrimastix pyriformis]
MMPADVCRDPHVTESNTTENPPSLATAPARSCVYSCVGCDEPVAPTERAAHGQANLGAHMDLMLGALTSAQAEAALTKQELAQTRQNLDQIRQELTQNRQTLDQTRRELGEARRQAALTQHILDQTRHELSQSRQDIAALTGRFEVGLEAPLHFSWFGIGVCPLQALAAILAPLVEDLEEKACRQAAERAAHQG